jgi:hypothetical protein
VATREDAMATVGVRELKNRLSEYLARWGGGKPRGSARSAKLRKGPPMSRTVIEGRR